MRQLLYRSSLFPLLCEKSFCHAPTFAHATERGLLFLFAAFLSLQVGTTAHAHKIDVKVKVKVSYLTSVAKQAKTAFLHGPTV